VIPVSWYPDISPRDQEKWKIPSCVKCNSEYGSLESDLLLRFGLCLDPNDALASGVSESALRSIKPEFAKSERDRRARAAKRASILAETIPVGQGVEGELPGFGLTKGALSGSGILVPAGTLKRFGVKLVRGTTFIDTGMLIEDPLEIGVHFVPDGSPAEPILQEVFASYSVRSDWGPGVILERGYLPEDSIQGLHRFLLWGRFRGYAWVRDRNESEEIHSGETT